MASPYLTPANPNMNSHRARRNTRGKSELETIKNTLSKRGNLSPKSKRASQQTTEIETFPQAHRGGGNSKREPTDIIYSSTQPVPQNTLTPPSSGRIRSHAIGAASNTTRMTPPSSSGSNRSRNQQSSIVTPPSSGGSGRSRSRNNEETQITPGGRIRRSQNNNIHNNSDGHNISSNNNLEKMKRDIGNIEVSSSSVSRSMRQPIQDAYSLVNLDHIDNQRRGHQKTKPIPVSPIKNPHKILPNLESSGNNDPVIFQRSPSPILSPEGTGEGKTIEFNDDDQAGSRIDKIYELRRRRQHTSASISPRKSVGSSGGGRSPRRLQSNNVENSKLPLVHSSKPHKDRNTEGAMTLPKGGLGIVGLKNLGNTCFMNTALQCLLATEKLTSYFQINKQLFGSASNSSSSSKKLLGGGGKNGSGVANTFNLLVQQLVQSGSNLKPPPIAPQELKTMVARNAPWLIGNQQHDCQEFLRYLLDAISEDLKLLNKNKNEKSSNQSEEMSSTSSSPSSSSSPQDDDDDEKTQSEDECDVVGNNSGKESGTNSLNREEKLERKESNRRWKQCRKNSTIVEEVFQGQLRSRVECCVCHHVSFCFDPFLEISVPIPESAKQLEDVRGGRQRGGGGSSVLRVKSATLEDCLKCFTEKEILDDENRFMCEKCKIRQRCEKTLTVHRWPSILVLQIKRFQYTTYSREKLSTSVMFPTKGLEIRPFLSHPDDPNELVMNNNGSGGSSGCDHGSSIYDLYGVSNHMGGLGGGHYTASCRHEHLGENKWFLYNDSNVSPLNDERDLQSPVAYVLYYKQRVLHNA